jgi:hypothetical protein
MKNGFQFILLIPLYVIFIRNWRPKIVIKCNIQIDV